MKPKSKRLGIGLAALACVTMTAAAIAADRGFTVATWGGTYTEKQRKSFFDPFSAESGIAVLDDGYTGGLGQIRAMVEANNVKWDVVDLGAPETVAGCEEGLLEQLDPGRLTHVGDFGADGMTDCGIGLIRWSMVIAYNTELTDDKPKSWVDFWDVERYPGKRALRRDARYALEAALLADGVPRDKIYETLRTKEGVDRAFKKLEQIRDDLVWWEKGSQPPEWLSTGEVAMSTSYVGRVVEAAEEGRPVAFSWDGALYTYSYWAVVKDSPNLDQAYAYLNYATGAAPQAAFSTIQPVAPVNPKSIDHLSAERIAILPLGPNLDNQLHVDTEFWIDNLESLNENLNVWLAQ